MPKSRVRLKQYGVRVNGVRIRKCFATAAEARRWQRTQKDLQDQIRSGAKRHIDPVFLDVQAQAFLDSRKGMESHGHQVTWMDKYITGHSKMQKRLLHEITRGDWKQIFGPQGDLVKVYKLAPATHNRIRAMVHKLYEDARREYEPPRAGENPIHDIKPLKEPKGSPQILATLDEIRRFIESAYQDKQAPEWGIFTFIKLNTGLRQQNIIPLRWKDWTREGTRLEIREKYVRTKAFTGFKAGNKSDAALRKVGVNDALREALTHWRETSRFAGPEDFIVADQGDGAHITQMRIWRANKRTIERAGLPYMSEHKLRHSYASHYLASGGNMHDLKENLFHSTITTTEIYSHALETELARRAAAFQTPKLTPKRKEESK